MARVIFDCAFGAVRILKKPFASNRSKYLFVVWTNNRMRIL